MLTTLVPSLLLAFQLGSIELDESPSDLHFYARDAAGLAQVEYRGRVPDADATAVRLVVQRDGEAWAERRWSLDPARRFAGRVEIEAGLHLYDFDLYLVSRSGQRHVHRAGGVVSGDAYLIQGQSNAAATDGWNEDLANQEQNVFIRSFGTASLKPNQVLADTEWHLADGENGGAGMVGAWGLRLGNELLASQGVPIGLLNGAVGGTRIRYHLRDDAHPTALTTNYGRLLWRAQRAHVDTRAKALIWYQGESDGANDPAEYEAKFTELIEDWRADYPAVARFYVFQVHKGCGGPTTELQDVQRRFADTWNDVSVVSTQNAPLHDTCHYFTAGYWELGERIARLIERDFYGTPHGDEVESPNPMSAAWLDANQDSIVLTLRHDHGGLAFEAGAEDRFDLVGSSRTVQSIVVLDGQTLLLVLDGSAAATGLDYAGSQSGGGPDVVNQEGIGMLAFAGLPITP